MTRRTPASAPTLGSAASYALCALELCETRGVPRRPRLARAHAASPGRSLSPTTAADREHDGGPRGGAGGGARALVAARRAARAARAAARARPRAAAGAAAAVAAAFLYAARWASLADCSQERVDDAYAPAEAPPPFPAHARGEGDAAASPVDVVYVTAFPGHARSSLRSLCYFAAPAGVLGTVHLVVPDRMAAFFATPAVLAALQCPRATAWAAAGAGAAGGASASAASAVAAPVLKFAVWPESRLVPRFTDAAPYSGTTRQMALKLAAATIVKTPFYLVMDSDVYARRRFSRADLLEEEEEGGAEEGGGGSNGRGGGGGGGGAAAGTAGTAGTASAAARGAAPSPPRRRLPPRARTNLDQLDFCQPPTWFNQASRALGSRLVADTAAFCGRVAAAAGFPRTPPRGCPPPSGAPAGAPEWFAATGNATVPRGGRGVVAASRGATATAGGGAGGGAGVAGIAGIAGIAGGAELVVDAPGPFDLLVDPATGREVYGACRSGRGHAVHVTPMLLARAIVLDVLAPRLVAEAARGRSRSGGGGGAFAGTWLDALLDFHEAAAAGCRQGGALSGRFYTWTEYSLYFVAAAASRALGQYHAFAAGGGITSIGASMMQPWQYDAADWGAIFGAPGSGSGARGGGAGDGGAAAHAAAALADDARPFFIVHSWFGKPVELTDARMAPFVPTLAEGGAFPAPPPSPAPVY